MSVVQRWTLAVVCAATAMLMLDIAVVNTALSAIAADRGTGILNPVVSQVALSTVPPEQSGLAAGVNDTFRQAGIAVGVAALGALVPTVAAFGDGTAQAYVDGFHRPCGRARRSPSRRRRPRLR